MLRRNFLRFGAIATAAAVVVPQLSAKDFRATKPDAWAAHTVDDAIKALYGDITPIESGVTVGAPKVASNGGAIPVNVKSDIDAKSVAIFQDANPEAAVIVFEMSEAAILNYDIKMKMGASGTITAIVEGKDGKFYKGTKTLEVALGGCEG
ncbi:twin-arginine translocation signal domain-containing protein [Sulfurimonas sp. MAG313]|nr:thiosulfate oxidation carrier protein SoxY [Sulfurimonas sp. MAG313]MDF1879838.1 twin-arginine translocation signal domain-containing protein [Sulfurimonas sp. MAG313]